MRMKRRCKFEKYFRGRVNRIWQIMYGKEEEEIKKKFSEFSNFGGLRVVNAISWGERKNRKRN